MKENEENWSKNLKTLWRDSYLASHLDGKKIKKLLKNIVIEREFDDILETILDIN